jgi:DNA (cytosine-5)-methyltransferase 1
MFTHPFTSVQINTHKRSTIAVKIEEGRQHDYRSLNRTHWTFSTANPNSANVKQGFKPGKRFLLLGLAAAVTYKAVGLYGRLSAREYFHTTVTNVSPMGKQCWVLHPSVRVFAPALVG